MSTPVPADNPQKVGPSLSTIESSLRVASPSTILLPELLLSTSSSKATTAICFLQQEDDAICSVCDAPSLPGASAKIQFHSDMNDDEKARDNNNPPVSLYGYRGSLRGTESGTEGGPSPNLIFDNLVMPDHLPLI